VNDVNYSERVNSCNNVLEKTMRYQRVQRRLWRARHGRVSTLAPSHSLHATHTHTQVNSAWPSLPA